MSRNSPSADASSKALFDAAAPSKLWAEYEWNHGLDADREPETTGRNSS